MTAATLTKPARTLRIVKQYTPTLARVRIACPDKTGEYLVLWTGPATAKVREGFPAECSEVYDVTPAACTCKGFTYRGRCKHRDAVAKLATLRKPN